MQLLPLQDLNHLAKVKRRKYILGYLKDINAAALHSVDTDMYIS